MSTSTLAIDGGPQAVHLPLPARGHFGAEEKAAVDKLFDRAIETSVVPGYGGAEEEAYCRDFVAFQGDDGFADGVNSGTNAVYIALRALGPEPGGDIVVPAVTDPGGMMPVVLLGCRPVVADAAPGAYNIGPEQVEAALTPATQAIVVAHIGGEPADMPGILTVAGRHGLPVVEDCAQAHGATIGNRRVGTFGDIAAFSTMWGKHHCTGGQGGVVFTRSEDLYWRARRLADRGKPFGLENGTNCVAALNCNMSDFAAAIGRVQLGKLPDILRRRQAVAAALRPALASLPSIRIPELVSGGEHVYWWWRLEVDNTAIRVDNAAYCAALQAEGVPVGTSYRCALPSTMDWFPGRPPPIPNAEAAMDRQFNLTIHESWGRRETDVIATAFRKVDAAYRQ